MLISDFTSKLTAKGYQVEFHSHAEAILGTDFPDAVNELFSVLDPFSIDVKDLVAGGGGETLSTQVLRRSLSALNWNKHNFEIKKLIDGRERESISHEIDHVREMKAGKIGLEIEWNNKDPFYDRDLENFKRLHAEGAISVGVILTRGSSLQADIRELVAAFARKEKISSYDDLAPFGVAPTQRQKTMVKGRMTRNGEDFIAAWAHVFCQDKYGQATTHWRKLEDRVHRGVGNPCPLLMLGMPSSIVVV